MPRVRLRLNSEKLALQNSLETITNDIKFLSTLPSIKNYICFNESAFYAERAIYNYARTHQRVFRVRLFTNDGRELIATENRDLINSPLMHEKSKFVLTQSEHERFYKFVLRKNTTFPYFSIELDSYIPVARVILEIECEDQPMGFLMMSVNLTSLYLHLKREKREPILFMVVDLYGNIFFHSLQRSKNFYTKSFFETWGDDIFHQMAEKPYIHRNGYFLVSDNFTVGNYTLYFIEGLKARRFIASQYIYLAIGGILCVLVIITAFGILVYNQKLMIARVLKETQRLHEQLKIEKQRTEELLCEMCPPFIVKRLLSGETYIADWVDMISCIFIDFIGFTEFSRRVPAIKLVRILGATFALFDSVAECFLIYKVKTLGDGYMAVSGISGIPLPVTRSLQFSMSIGLLFNVVLPNLECQLFNSRMGVHCGPAIIGVLPGKTPHFDCWGPTINLSSRLEATSEPGEIHTTTSVYNQVIHEGNIHLFDFVKREKVYIKGYGEMNTFFVYPKELNECVPSNVQELIFKKAKTFARLLNENI